MLLLAFTALSWSAETVTVVPKLPAVLPCDNGQWTLRLGQEMTVTQVPESLGELTCFTSSCELPLTHPPEALILPAGLPALTHIALNLNCTDKRLFVKSTPWPPIAPGRFPIGVSVNLMVAPGPVAEGLEKPTIMAIPAKQPPATEESIRLAALLLQRCYQAVETCIGSGACRPEVRARLPATPPNQLQLLSTGAGPTDWQPSEARGPDAISWLVTLTDGTYRYELVNSRYDSITEGLSLRILNGTQPMSIITIGGLYEEFVDLDWDGGTFKMVNERDEGRVLRVHGDAIQLAATND